MRRKAQSRIVIGLVIFLIVLAIGIYKTSTTNEPLTLEVQPCYMGICMTGDYLKLNLCLNGIEDKTINVSVNSPALINESYLVPVNYKTCKDTSLQLRNDLKNEDYPITVTLPPIKDPGFFLQLKRLFTTKVLNNKIEELKNYKRDMSFKPKFPDVKLVVSREQCLGTEKKLIFKEMQIYIKESSAVPNYDCKFYIETRRFTEVKHEKITKIYESNEFSKEDKRLWESDYKNIDKVEGKSLLNVEIFTNTNYDYINPTIIPSCKVNNNDVIVYPDAKTFRCPNLR